MSTKKKTQEPTASNDVYDHTLDTLPACGVDLESCNLRWKHLNDEMRAIEEKTGEDARTSEAIEMAVSLFTPKELAFLWFNAEFKAKRSPIEAMMEMFEGGEE